MLIRLMAVAALLVLAGCSQGGEITNTDAGVDGGADGNAGTDAGPDGAGPDADAGGSDAGQDGDAGTDGDPGLDADAGADADTGPDADAGADADAGPDADAGADGDIGPDGDAGTDADEFEVPDLPDPMVGGTASLSLDDGTATHVFPPGLPFSVEVTVSGITSDVVAQWHAPAGGPISHAVIFTPPATVTVPSPDTRVGACELKIWSPDSLVDFPPQNPGFHRWFGFAVLPEKSVGDRELEPGSFFGMVHANPDDPYLRGGIKTVWTMQSPSEVVDKIAARRLLGLEELPAVASDQLTWNHNLPVTSGRLDEFRQVIRPFMDELQNRGVPSPDWQLGVEIDNQLDDGPHGIANYCQFARILREELDRVGATQRKIVSSFDGFDYSGSFGPLIAHPDSHHFDAIGTDPYAWWAPDQDFTMPDDESRHLEAPWLLNHIQTLRGFMDENPQGPQEIWFTEMGLPHGGNYDPDDFFGYPASGVETARRDRLYTAIYLVRAHVIAKASGAVSRIYWYNYRDRGGDLDYAEHHFGLRSHDPINTYQGHPKPIYVAYAILADKLRGATFTELRSAGTQVSVYDFQTAPGGHLWVAWSNADEPETLSLSELGETGPQPASGSSLFGRLLDLTTGTITVPASPVYVVVP